jgi:DNA polymerase III epsilon subunit-like protein
MIILDTEATSLTISPILPIAQRPYVIEITALKCGTAFLEDARFSTLVRAPVPIPEECTKITKLTTADLAEAPSFAKVYPDLSRFLLGEEILIAHNLPYDVAVLATELERIQRETAFPWPPRQICTVELTQYLTGKYLKLAELYEALFEERPLQAHRAASDAEMLLKCCGELYRQRKLQV